jgi:hypothetical protein
MTDNNSIKQIVADVTNNVPTKKPLKTNRTLSLNDANFRELQTYCREHGVKTSDVLDRLIETFLKEAGRKVA